MKSACKSFSESLNIHVTVKLRAGKSVKADAKSEPLRSKECGRIECMSCTPGGKGGCERNGIGYRITCEGCQGNGVIAEYEGESGRNGYSRGLEHAADLRNESDKSPLWKHCQLLHGGEKQKFLMVVLSSFRSCLERQVNEAVRITSSKAEVILNSKTEFHQAPIRRVVATAGLQTLQAKDQGWVAVGRRGGTSRATRGLARAARGTPRATRGAGRPDQGEGEGGLGGD